MIGYYCLNCGEKLKQLSMNPSIDKYECPKCCATWYKKRHIIVEWVEGEKKESEAEYNMVPTGGNQGAKRRRSNAEQ